ncbi:MAG TPA: glycosyltransferase [Anaeromyxobacteraceae bacterium]|nr:glycosyltransferase [Anaeromyxobacteraceae bacterium]
MRVLMTADTIGGVFTYASELAGALAARGVEVALATTGRRLAADQRAELRRARVGEVFESAWKLEWMEDPWTDVARTSAWLAGVAQRVRPDVVHLNEFAHGALPLGAPALVVGHSCVVSWFEAVRGCAPPASFDRYREVVRRGLASADLVVAPTAAMLGALERHHGPLGRARVIPNGRAPERFRPAAKEPFVLCAARLWDDAKNAAALDAVAAGLPWPVLLAGEEDHPDGARGARSSGARLLGRLSQEELARAYGRAAVYALPARYEPFGLSVLEAAHAGCALVLGDLASLRETWDGAAVFVAPDDHVALRDALRRLCADPARRAELSTLARARAAALTPDRMAAAYASSYASLAPRAWTAEESAPCAS